MMRRLWMGLLAGLIGAMVLAGCGGSPAVAIEPLELDLGQIPATVPASGTARLTNTGDGVLELGELRTSCGCTTAHTDRTRLRPGEAADLTITFDPQAHPGLYGPLMRMVYVPSNAGPDLEVPVFVVVLAPEEARP